MKKILNIITISSLIVLITACVPVPKPNIGIGIGGAVDGHHDSIQNESIIDKKYGAKPINYINSIQKYFATKIARANLSKYKYGKPKRAYKRKGFAYGGDIAWRGWLVETSIATPTRTGRLLTPKPYMVLFSGEQIVEHILGYNHKLITKVDK